jgi:hypothetical protein
MVVSGGSDGGLAQTSARAHVWSSGSAPFALVAIFAASRIVFYLAGLRFDMTALTGQTQDFQLLDLPQLHHNLIQSIWYLHSQPPLFNLFTGLLLKLPSGFMPPTLVVSSLLLGLGLVLSCYYLCLELRIPKWASFVVTVFVVLDPVNVLYGNWYFYSFPTATAMTFGALCLARYIRTKLWKWGLGFFGALAFIVLINSTFQWFWLLAVAAPLAISCRRQWRAILAVAAVPLLLVGLWYVKDAVLFQTSTTSSWLGMNLAKATTDHASKTQLRKLIREKKISTIALIPPFEPLKAYHDKYNVHPKTGVVVLDQRSKNDGSPNFNNINYITIANQYLHDDLAFIVAYPRTYARTVRKAALLFFVPPEQYFFVGKNSNHISAYVNAFDRFIDWQPRSTDILADPFSYTKIQPSQISFASVITYGIVVFLSPFIFWRRRCDVPFALGLVFMWMSTVYVFVVSTLIDFGENERFRYDLGPIPLIAAIAILSASLAKRRGRSASSSSGQSEDTP